MTVCVLYLVGLSGCVGRRLLLVLFQPLGGAAVDDLFPQPDQADERTQGARHYKTTLKTIRKQVVSGKE